MFLTGESRYPLLGRSLLPKEIRDAHSKDFGQATSHPSGCEVAGYALEHLVMKQQEKVSARLPVFRRILEVYAVDGLLFGDPGRVHDLVSSVGLETLPIERMA